MVPDRAYLWRWVEKRLSPPRLAHTLRVEEEAKRLAMLHGANLQKTAAAALLHDCAKDIPREAQLRMAEAFGIVFTDVERCNSALLHAPLGAEIARREAGVNHETVLDAIRWHTTGRAGMSLLEKVIFIADYAEPGRAFAGLDKVRDAARSNLDTALLLALEQTIGYVLQKGWLLHSATVQARNELILKCTEKEGH